MWTSHDPTLSTVKKFVLQGWLDTKDPNIQPYHHRKTELSVQDGCLLWGNRVIIPPQGRKKVLEELHAAHYGIFRMKSLARSYMWWPNMDAEIEAKVKIVLNVRKIGSSHHQYLCYLGNGHPSHGHVYTSTMQDHSWERCS